MSSGRLIDYLGYGTFASRPATLTNAANVLGLYWASDTNVVYIWNGSAWVAFPGAGGGIAWGSISGTLSSQTDLNTALLARALLSGANVFTQQQAVTPYRANISGTVSIDLNGTAKSNNLHLTLTGNVTSFALTNPVDGAVYNIRFIQDATGGRTMPTLTGGVFKFGGGTAPVFSTTANAVDFMSMEYGTSENTYMCGFVQGMA